MLGAPKYTVNSNHPLRPHDGGSGRRGRCSQLLHHNSHNSPSSTYIGNGSVLGSWGRGSEGTTHTLNVKCFKGARLRTPMSVYLQEDGTKLASKTSRRVHDDGSENKNLHLGANPGLLHRAARRTLLGGCKLIAHRLGGCPTSTCHLDGGTPLPNCSGADHLTSTTVRVGPWPPPAARETCTSGAPPPQTIND
jgi:hypothetical protein